MNHMFDFFWTSSKTIQPFSSCQFSFSKVLSIKTNYEIHDKELLAIMDVF